MRRSHDTGYHLRLFFAAAILVAAFCGRAFPDNASLDNRLRETCVETLRTAMYSDTVMETKARAAEALIMNAYPDGVADYFESIEAAQGADTACKHYVLALSLRKDPSVFGEHAARIAGVLNDCTREDSLAAFDCLARLGEGARTPGIAEIAAQRSPAAALSLWILAKGGSSAAETSLAALLADSDTQTAGYAAYALGKLDKVGQDTFDALEQAASRTDTGSPALMARLAAACFVHAPENNAGHWKEALLSHAAGEPRERAIIAEALAERGSVADISLLEHLLGDSCHEVSASAANAILRIERRQFRGIQWPDWIVIVGYAAAMLGIGWYYAKRQRTSDDYLVGGRRVGSFVSGISLFASYLSTISYLAIAGEVIKHGPLVFLIHIASIVVVYPLTAYCLIPFFMKLPITSAYEIIEKPLGKGVRIAGSVIFLVTRFVWMALLIYLTSKALVVMLGWDERFIMYISIAGGIITVIYSTMGGLRAVVTTDVTQFFILILGALFTIVLVSADMGGPAAWFPREWAPGWDRVVLISFDPRIRLTVFFTVIHVVSWWVSTAGSDQMAIQRFVSTKNVNTARHAFLFAQVGEKILFTILICVGFALLSFYRSNPQHIPDGRDLLNDADFLFPNFIANHLPLGVSGLVIAAIFSAAMSSLSSGINSTAAVITTDILPWLTGKTRDDSGRLSLARWCSLAVGILVVAISSGIGRVPGNILEVTTKTNGLFVCPLFNLFFMALFVSFATPLGTIAGTAYGVSAAAVIAFWDVLTGQPGLTFLWIGPSSLVVSIACSMLFSLIPSRGKSIAWQTTAGCALMVPVALGVAALIYL